MHKAKHHGVIEEPILRDLHHQVDNMLYNGGCKVDVAAGALEKFRRALFARIRP